MTRSGWSSVESGCRRPQGWGWGLGWGLEGGVGWGGVGVGVGWSSLEVYPRELSSAEMFFPPLVTA